MEPGQPAYSRKASGSWS